MDSGTRPGRAVKVIATTVGASFSGPLPPPDTLIRYNDAVPNAADRIITMAEQQAAHRRQMESAYLAQDHLRSVLGIGAGLVVVLAVLAASVFLVVTGNPVAGTILGSVDIIGLASVFVYANERRRSERLEKARIMTQGDSP